MEYRTEQFRGQLASGTTAPSPTITAYLPVENPQQIGMLIYPGGGYNMLAEHEGHGYAKRFCDAGIACFVIEYRLVKQGHKHPEMLEDALSAMAQVRAHAKHYGIHPDRIGVAGSSAGGHLAGHHMTRHNSYSSDTPLHPNFAVLAYPVVLASGDAAHKGSIIGLSGEDPVSEAMQYELSIERHISKDNAPCFIWHTVEDAGVPVENSLALARALSKHNIPFELHCYEHGRHGLGLAEDMTYDWSQDCVRWIRERFA